MTAMTFDVAPGLQLPSNAVTQTFGWIARRGAGKSYGAGVFAEQLLKGGAQVVVIDPVGIWWGLRLAANGKDPGIPIAVFGGDHGDIPLEATAGAVMAQLVVERRISCVLDVSQFDSDAEQKRFVTDFARTLFNLKKRNRSPVHLIFEEAQEFLPQVFDAGSAAMVGAVSKLWKIGRNYGIGGSLITLRPQSVHKGSLNLTEVLCVGQLTGPHERKTIAGWVNDQGMDAEAVAELPRLPIGTFYVWSPQWLARFLKVRINKKTTFDTSATPDENTSAAPTHLAPINLEEIRKLMHATIEAAKDSDPALLHKEIRRLKAELATAPGRHDMVSKISEDAVRLAAERDRAIALVERWRNQSRLPAFIDQAIIDIGDAVENAFGAASKARHHLRNLTNDLQSFSRVGDHLPSFEAKLPPIPAVSRAGSHPRVSASTEAARGGEAAPPQGGSDGDGAARMLRALASRHPRPLTREQLGVLAVIKPSGGSFGTYVSKLKTSRLIEIQGGLLSLTPAGLQAAPPGAQPGAEQLLDTWRGKLDGKAKDMLLLLAQAVVDMTKAEIAQEVGMDVAGGSFGTYLSRLKSNGLIVRGPGGFRVVAELAIG
jgi:hypothetical protein